MRLSGGATLGPHGIQSGAAGVAEGLLEHETVTLHLEEGPRYRYLSLLPLDRTVEGVSIDGVKYPLTDAAILRGDTLTVSNQPAGPVVSATVGDGRALLIRSERDA